MSLIQEETILTFFKAIVNDDTRTVETIAKKYPQIIHTTHGFKKLTPIHECQTVKMLETIIRMGADVKGMVGQWDTPIAKLSRNTSTVSKQMIQVLIQHGADPNQRDILGRNAYFYADHGMMDTLSEIGTMINTRDTRGETPLHYACDSMTSIDEIFKLIKNGGDPRIHSNSGLNPIDLLLSNEIYFPWERSVFYKTVIMITLAADKMDEGDRKDKIWNRKREFALGIFAYIDRTEESPKVGLKIIQAMIEHGVCGDGYRLFDEGKPWGRLVMEYI